MAVLGGWPPPIFFSPGRNGDEHMPAESKTRPPEKPPALFLGLSYPLKEAAEPVPATDYALTVQQWRLTAWNIGAVVFEWPEADRQDGLNRIPVGGFAYQTAGLRAACWQHNLPGDALASVYETIIGLCEGERDQWTFRRLMRQAEDVLARLIHTLPANHRSQR
jgi:hypothetical protein